MIKIIDVQLQTNYNWGEVKQRTPTWQAIKNEYPDWQQLTQTTLITQQVNIVVDLVENNWAGVLRLYDDWQQVNTTVSTWDGLKNI